jgi:hypothetical protein
MADMRNGLWRDDEGYFAMVDGVNRTFNDDKLGAYELARELKRRKSPEQNPDYGPLDRPEGHNRPGWSNHIASCNEEAANCGDLISVPCFEGFQFGTG